MNTLPAWGKDELPKPLPFSPGNLFRVIGPGAILLATSIGGGEWMVGPAMAVKFGASMMWVATIGIVLQVLFNLEGIRYTLYTGEPILSGIMRLRPGATFWATFYIALTAAQLGVPALAKACATVVFTAFAQRLPTPADESALLWITYGVILLGVLLLTFGGTVERMLEWLSWSMIVYIFGFLVYVNVTFIPLTHSAETLRGFFRFGYWPSEMDLLLFASLAATAGSGGIGNLAITNWVRDKGMGMGRQVGAIPSAFGSKHVRLSHVGKVFAINEENLGRWRTWWKYAVADQFWLWAVGCFIGMYLNVNLASHFIPAGTEMDGVAAGVQQVQHMSQKLWSGLWVLGLLNGFWILFSTHLGNIDVLVRTITDIVWVASPAVRESKKLTVGRVYYGLLAVFCVWGLIAVHLANAMTLFKILATVAGFVLVPAAIQILIINSTMLPRELRPPLWRRVALVLCAIFYAVVSTAAMYDVVRKTFGAK